MFAKPSVLKGGTGGKKVYWSDGAVTLDLASAMAKGGFTGKAGTMKRSRKGRTYRAPNGSRTYLNNWWDETTVIAYQI
jgi:hypothetical protein